MKYLYTVCVSNQIEIYKVFSQQMRERVLVTNIVYSNVPAIPADNTLKEKEKL